MVKYAFPILSPSSSTVLFFQLFFGKLIAALLLYRTEHLQGLGQKNMNRQPIVKRALISSQGQNQGRGSAQEENALSRISLPSSAVVWKAVQNRTMDGVEYSDRDVKFAHFRADPRKGKAATGRFSKQVPRSAVASSSDRRRQQLHQTGKGHIRPRGPQRKYHSGGSKTKNYPREPRKTPRHTDDEKRRGRRRTWKKNGVFRRRRKTTTTTEQQLDGSSRYFPIRVSLGFTD